MESFPKRSMICGRRSPDVALAWLGHIDWRMIIMKPSALWKYGSDNSSAMHNASRRTSSYLFNPAVFWPHSALMGCPYSHMQCDGIACAHGVVDMSGLIAYGWEATTPVTRDLCEWSSHRRRSCYSLLSYIASSDIKQAQGARGNL